MIIVKSRRLAIQGMEQIPDPGVIFKKTREKKKRQSRKQGRLERVEPDLSNTSNIIEAETKKSKSVLRQKACKWVYSGMGEISSHERGGSNLLYLVFPGPG
jgi:hypothetical protein